MDAEVYFLPNDKLHCTRNTESSTYFGNFLYALIFINTVPIVRNVLILPSKHVFVIVNFLKMRNVLCFSCKYYTKCLKCQYWSTSWDPLLIISISSKMWTISQGSGVFVSKVIVCYIKGEVQLFSTHLLISTKGVRFLNCSLGVRDHPTWVSSHTKLVFPI